MFTNMATDMSREALVIRELIKCVNFSAVKHKDQRRKCAAATPYINHPIGVAYILVEEGDVTDPEVIQAAILHDTVEDTDTTLEELKERFGNTVACIVDECSDDKTLGKADRKQQQILKAKTSSSKAKLVKLADKLYNLRDLETNPPVDWSIDRQEEYFAWAFQVCQGLRGTNSKLEQELDKIFKRRKLMS